VVADSEFDMTASWSKLECVLDQVEQDLRVDDPICANVLRNLVYYLEFKCDMSLASLNVVRLQELFDKAEHRVF